MYRILSCIFLLLATYCNESHSDNALLESEMRKWDIVPEMLDRAPPQVLSVKYAYNNTVVVPGKELFYKQTRKPPEVTWEAKKDDLYILYFVGLMERDLSWVELIDPTLTTPIIPPRIMLYELWLVTNIPGNNVDNGTVLREYMEPPRPMPNITETYLFLLFKQRSFIPPDTMKIRKDPETQDEYSVREFMSAFGLDPPIAGNFFYRVGPEDLVWRPGIDKQYEE